jgi:membrane associated rhomboid family serine protease
MKAPSRTPTTFAVGFLALDALLLGYAGVALARPLLVASGGVCALAAVLAVLGWRRHRRALAEIEAARKAMRTEAESIRELLKERHLHN